MQIKPSIHPPHGYNTGQGVSDKIRRSYPTLGLRTVGASPLRYVSPMAPHIVPVQSSTTTTAYSAPHFIGSVPDNSIQLSPTRNFLPLNPVSVLVARK